MGNLNTVDFVIIALLVIGGISGAIKGFLEELSQKFGLILGLVASLMFTQALTPVVQDKLSLPLWVSAGISFVAIFLVGYLIMKLFGSVLQAIFKSTNVSFVDYLLGFLLGVFEMLLLVGVIVTLLYSQKVINVHEYIEGSLIVNKVTLPIYNSLVDIVKKVL